MVVEGSESVRPSVFHLDILVELQEGRYVAHCLQMDIVTTGTSGDAAVSDMLDLINAHINFAMEHNNVENIFKPAPPEVWRKLWGVCSTDTSICKTKPLPRVTDRPRMEATVCYA